ncbi:MAG: inositol-3-phosphate synthase, partial [Chloroflexota bacterium]
IIGVSNCASSLKQVVHFYRNAKADDRIPSQIYLNLGGYHNSDPKFTALCNVVNTKVGKGL